MCIEAMAQRPDNLIESNLLNVHVISLGMNIFVTLINIRMIKSRARLIVGIKRCVPFELSTIQHRFNYSKFLASNPRATKIINISLETLSSMHLMQ